MTMPPLEPPLMARRAEVVYLRAGIIAWPAYERKHDMPVKQRAV